MRPWLAAVSVFGIVSCPLIVGCGSGGSVDFYSTSAGGVSASAGSTGAAGHDSDSAGSAGALTVAGAGESAGGSSAGSTSGPSDEPCSPSVVGEGGMSGPFGTKGAVCYRISADITGWGCSNFDGRVVKVNGVTVSCAEVPLPDKRHGDYYFDISAGDLEYASIYWF
jgi:hypothetical protein